jgi:hypothetical protein
LEESVPDPEVDIDDDIAQIWKEVQYLMESIHLDVLKNEKRANALAGVRLRHGLRLMRTRCLEMIKKTILRDRQRKIGRTLLKRSKIADGVE